MNFWVKLVTGIYKSNFVNKSRIQEESTCSKHLGRRQLARVRTKQEILERGKQQSTSIKSLTGLDDAWIMLYLCALIVQD